MRYEEVKKAQAEFDGAKRNLDEAKNAYLASHGFREVIDYDQGTVYWTGAPSGHESEYFSYGSRCDAINAVRRHDSDQKRVAEELIAKLKAEHGIEEPAK